MHSSIAMTQLHYYSLRRLFMYSVDCEVQSKFSVRQLQGGSVCIQCSISSELAVLGADPSFV